MHKTDREYKELAIVPHMSDSRFATELSVSFRNSGIDPALSNPSAGHAQSDAGFYTALQLSSSRQGCKQLLFFVFLIAQNEVANNL
jgi:hypothetical protein